MATDQASGMSTHVPFAYFDRDSCSWRMCQASLLEASGESCTTWPRQGTWDRGFVWELPTSEHLTDESESSSSLLPTPGASDDHGGEGPTRDARRAEGKTGGPALRDIGHLLPTPTGRDYKDGVPNENVETNALLGRAVWDLLPTPNASDGPKGGPNRRDGKGEPYLSGISQLLPTPVANPDNPGAGGELRAALEHGPGRRNETGVDSMGRPNRGRPSRLLLPTPKETTNRASRRAMVDEAQWASPQLEQVAELATGHLPREFDSPDEIPGASRQLHGDHTSPRFGGGSTSSADRHPDQLTLEDA